MKLANITEENLNEIEEYLRYNPINIYSKNQPNGKGPGRYTPPKRMLLTHSIITDSLKLSKFLIECFIESEYFRKLFDYTEDQILSILSSVTDRKNKQLIVNSINSNLEILLKSFEENHKKNVIELGYDEDVSDILITSYFEKLLGPDRFYKDITNAREKFFENARFNKYNDDDEMKMNILKKLIYYDSIWNWLKIKNYHKDDIKITKREISSEFENKTPGYIGIMSGDLIVKDVITIIFDDGYNPVLKFQTELTERLDTRGFW